MHLLPLCFFRSRTDLLSLLFLCFFELRPFQESVRMGMKFGRIVFQVNTHRSMDNLTSYFKVAAITSFFASAATWGVNTKCLPASLLSPCATALTSS